MLGLYLFSAILGGGLLLFSMLGGGDHGGSDHDLGGHDGDLGGHDAGADHGGGHDDASPQQGAGELVVGLFRPRNLIFFLASFGITGSLLTLLQRVPGTTLALSLAMGVGAMSLSHGIFFWLRRSDSATEAISEDQLEGTSARVVLPLEPGQRGRVVAVVADREQYLTARLAPDSTLAIPAGREVVILRITDGVAEVAPFDVPGLPPGASANELASE